MILSKQKCCLLLKVTWTVIYYWRQQPYFSYRTFFLKHCIDKVCVIVEFIFMGLLARSANRELKIKNLAHSGTPTHDPWISKSLPLPLGHEYPAFIIICAIYVLHLNERQSSCIQYCSHITSVSICCLKNIYWTKKERYIKFSLQLRIFHLNIVKVCTVI